MRRLSCSLSFVLLAGCAGPGSPAASPAGSPASSAAAELGPPLAAVHDPTAQLEALRVEAGLPALAAAYVTSDGHFDAWATGERAAGSDVPAQATDIWHLGSCTKAMTATLVALLVERGDLAWDAPLVELLPELADEVAPDLRDVTLPELLGHRAGLGNALDLGRYRDDPAVAGLTLVEQRALAARDVLTDEGHPPRGEWLYSNLGYVVAGHIAERATGEAWEDLIRRLLFEPLGMTSAGFGAPGSPEQVDQPRGHTRGGEPLAPGPRADNPAVLGPAGTVHATLADWARFVRLHLAGDVGDVQVGDILLHRATFERLHRALDGPGQRYALGWVVEQRAWAGGDGHALWHNGSNTLWTCVTWLGPGNGLALLAATNQAPESAQRALDRAVGRMLQEVLVARASEPQVR